MKDHVISLKLNALSSPKEDKFNKGQSKMIIIHSIPYKVTSTSTKDKRLGPKCLEVPLYLWLATQR